VAIPIGTTARQLEAVARWMLAALVIVGMTVWWTPDHRNWGALAAGILGALGLWLTWRTVLGDRSVPGHPIHLTLLLPAVLLAYHFADELLTVHTESAEPLAGALCSSAMFQLALLAAGIMLTQSLLPRAARHRVVLCFCGAAMMAGAGIGMVLGHTPEVRDALTMVGFAGAAVWLSPLWGVPETVEGGGPHPLRRRDIRIACAGVGVVALAIFQRFSWTATLWSVASVGLCLVLGGAILPRRRLTLVVMGGLLSAAAILAAATTLPPLYLPTTSWLGTHEAFGILAASDSGLAILVGTVGWLGAGWLLLGGVGCVIFLMLRARDADATGQGRTIVWATATALASGAVLCAGGPFIPAVTLGAALTWGLMPAMSGRPMASRSPLRLVVPIVLMMMVLAVARHSGLASWSANAFGLGDKAMHVLSGLLLASSLAWLLGARRMWLGLVGIAVALMAGAAGEVVQWVASTGRGAEFADWMAHSVGGLLAAVPYLLCMGARGCESEEALPTSPDTKSPYGYGEARP
jgi:hypothetical protein